MVVSDGSVYVRESESESVSVSEREEEEEGLCLQERAVAVAVAVAVGNRPDQRTFLDQVIARNDINAWLDREVHAATIIVCLSFFLPDTVWPRVLPTTAPLSVVARYLPVYRLFFPPMFTSIWMALARQFWGIRWVSTYLRTYVPYLPSLPWVQNLHPHE